VGGDECVWRGGHGGCALLERKSMALQGVEGGRRTVMLGRFPRGVVAGQAGKGGAENCC